MNKKIYVSFCGAALSTVGYEDLIIEEDVRYWNMETVQGWYDSIDSLIGKLSSWGFSNNKKDYSFYTSVYGGGVIVSSILVDEEGSPVEKGDELYNDWVSGNIDLYSANLYCEVSIVEERMMTDEDAIEFGISLYY